MIISSDKTQITLVGGKTAYPVYITIGNIPKEIRRKPSRHAHILLAYLPTTKLEHITNKSARRRMVANILHAALGRILKPLETAGIAGIQMTTGSGAVHRCHPIYAVHPGDYQEYMAITGCKQQDCPICQVEFHNLGNFNCKDDIRDLNKVKEALNTFQTDPNHFSTACREADIKPIPFPFWKNLPYTNIYLCIPPDILHQLHQGVIKHLISWIFSAYDKAEIDARCRRLPPNHHIRHFRKGVTHLSQLTGKEHAQIASVIMGLIVDLPLPGEYYYLISL